MHLIILINHASGTRSKQNFIKEISSQSLKKDWSFEVQSSWYVNDANNAKRIAGQKDTVVVICGGDGTVNKVIKAFWQLKLLNKIRFLIHPGGTFNALVKNTNYSDKSLKNISGALAGGKLIKADLLELTIYKGKTERKEIVHTGILLVKDCNFTRHAAEIQKALHQFDFRLGFRSIQKSLPYLDKIPSFRDKQNGKEKIIQGIYIANNPYLITKKRIHPGIKLNDGKMNVLTLKDADFFQFGQIASVLLLGAQKSLPFLHEESRKTFSFEVGETIDMNLDGDVESLDPASKIKISLSSQKINLLKYL